MTLIDLHESIDSEVISRRGQILARPLVGLGPEDVVVLVRKERSQFFGTNFSTKIKECFHSPGGFFLNSQAAFPAYFSELLQRMAKKWFKVNIIPKGYYYSWNSFSLKDVIVTVDNPGGCTSLMQSNGQCETVLTPEDWLQVSLSSKLRFYRCSQPLLAAVMFSKPVLSDSYYVYEVPPVSESEFEYCVKNHIPTDDFELAVAFALIINCELRYIFSFLKENDKNFPRIIFHIINHVSPKSKLCFHLIPILVDHMKMFSDDLEVAVIFMEIAVYHKKLEICKKYLAPLIQSSLWSSPKSGIAFARYCLNANRYHDAFEFMNIACFANNLQYNKYSNFNKCIYNKDYRNLMKTKKNSDIESPTFNNNLFFNNNNNNNNSNNNIIDEDIKYNFNYNFCEINYDLGIEEINEYEQMNLKMTKPFCSSHNSAFCITTSSGFFPSSPNFSGNNNNNEANRNDNSNNNVNKSSFLAKNATISLIANNLKSVATNLILEYGPLNKEKFLLCNPFTSLKNQIILTLGKLIAALGDTSFFAHQKMFIKDRKIITSVDGKKDKLNKINKIDFFKYNTFPQPQENFRNNNNNNNNNTNNNNNNNDIYKRENINETSFNASKNRLYDNFDSNDIIDENFDFKYDLYDPGVEGNFCSDLVIQVDNHNNKNYTRSPSQLNVSQNINLNINNTNFFLNAKNRNSINSNSPQIAPIFRTLSNSHSYSSLNNNNYNNDGNEFDEMVKLSDEIKNKLNISKFFTECIKQVQNDFEESSLIMAQQKEVLSQTHILMMALRTNDSPLMDAVLNSFNESNKASGIDKILLLKGYTMNVTNHLDAILTLPMGPTTVLEKNALKFMEPFAIGIHRLNNSSL